MRSFIKALVIANLVFFAIAAAVACVAGVTMSFIVTPEGASQSTNISDIFASHSTAAAIVLTVVVVSASLCAGYLAARMTGTRPIAAGALATGAWTLVNAVARFSGLDPGIDFVPGWLESILLFGGPVFGALGGALAPVRASELVRWGLALVVWTAMESVIATMTGHGLGGSVLLVFGVAVAIVAIIAIISPRQRQVAGIAMVLMTIAVPLGEFIRHLLTDRAMQAAAEWLFVGGIGSAIALLKIKDAFPSESGGPGAWWWLSSSGALHWSPEERRSRLGMLAILGVVWIVGFSTLTIVLEKIGIDAHVGAPLAALILLPAAAIAARPLYASLLPQTLRRADENATARLAHLDAPPNSA